MVILFGELWRFYSVDCDREASVPLFCRAKIGGRESAELTIRVGVSVETH